MRILFWFRQDLRLEDNPGFSKAAERGEILPIYILDKHIEEGGRHWLHHSLQCLNQSLEGHLGMFQGNPLEIILMLKKKYEIDAIYWNRCYEPWHIQQEVEVKKIVHLESFNGSLLWEPWDVLKQNATPYKVFTPYFKKGCLQNTAPRRPLPKPSKIKFIPSTDRIEVLKLLSPSCTFNTKGGERAAADTLATFLKKGLPHYREKRDVPAEKVVSRLSSHLHFGEISPHQVWHSVRATGHNENTDSFLRQLAWREFSYYLLYHFPHLPDKNLQQKFDAFPWQWESPHIEKWKRGMTGYPFVDAGMRQLLREGYMHNRMRMVVGSFLVKNLLIHWKVGANHFWERLTDADLANNSAGWQWIAGSGSDAAPYFRIFNPVTQGEKFDPQGSYTRWFVPELKDVPIEYLFKPWEAPPLLMQKSHVILGKTYPLPIVDLKQSRDRALNAFRMI